MSMSRRALPPLNALRAFEGAGRRLNFRAAAEDLGVTQGAVAQQVRALEDHLGFALFDRLPRGLALTPRGAAYLARLSLAFDLLCEATAETQDKGVSRPQTITISVTPTFGIKLLVPRLTAFKDAIPWIDLRTLATEEVSDLDGNLVDIAVRLTRGPLPVTYEASPLFSETLIAVASPSLLEGRPRPLSREALRDLPLVHDGHCHWSRILGFAGKLPGPVFNHTALAIDAALAGHGVALCCRAFVEDDLAHGRLLRVGDVDWPSGLIYHLVRKRRKTQSAASQATWDWCTRTLISAV